MKYISLTNILAAAVILGTTFLPLTACEAQPLDFETAPRALASMLIEGIDSAGKVGVIRFPDSHGRYLPLSNWLAGTLSTELFELPGDHTVVERQQLESLLEELELSESGLVDPESAKKSGRLLGLDAMVVGHLTVTAEVVEISARTVRTDTGAMLSSGKARIRRDSVPAELLGPGRKPQPLLERGDDSEPLADWEFGPLRVVAKSITRSSDHRRVTVQLELENLSDDELALGIAKESFGRCGMSLSDNAGSSLLPIGDLRGSGINCVTKNATLQDYTRLEAHSTTPVSMTFKANEGEEIHGTVFQLNIRFVFRTDQGRKETTAGLAGLRLTPR